MKKLNQSQIVERTKEVCDVLQLEFIFSKACQSLDAKIIEAILTFQTSDILTEAQVSLMCSFVCF